MISYSLPISLGCVEKKGNSLLCSSRLNNRTVKKTYGFSRSLETITVHFNVDCSCVYDPEMTAIKIIRIFCLVLRNCSPIYIHAFIEQVKGCSQYYNPVYGCHFPNFIYLTTIYEEMVHICFLREGQELDIFR